MGDRVHGDVMLVGSMPYDDAETVLRKAGQALRGHARFLPDGEVGAGRTGSGCCPSTSTRTTPASRRRSHLLVARWSSPIETSRVRRWRSYRASGTSGSSPAPR